MHILTQSWSYKLLISVQTFKSLFRILRAGSPNIIPGNASLSLSLSSPKKTRTCCSFFFPRHFVSDRKKKEKRI